MPTGLPYDAKEQVRAAVDIVDLVGSYLNLRRQGRTYVALCPWHDDRRPSLQVNPERQSWKCWVCDVGGDVFSFLMKREGVEFREALQMLADRAGVSLAPIGGESRRGQPGGADDKRTLYRAMAWAQQQFHECLLSSPEAEPARRYIHERGVSQQSVQRFHLGFSPNSWQWLIDRAKSTEYSTKVLQTVDLIALSPNSGRPYDRFRGRLMFPIRDLQKQTIAFGGRQLPEFANEKSGKYINSRETRLFSKSDQLYGLDLARDAIRDQGEVVVVEGYTDVVMSVQHGLENVVAILGTALGTRQIGLLRRFADRIVLLLDGDQAGQKRAGEVLELFVAEQADLCIAGLPSGKDPCDLVCESGKDALVKLISSAVDALEHKVKIETEGIDLIHDIHRAHQSLERVLATLARAPRLQTGTSTSMRLREQQLLARLARQFGVPEAEIRTRLTTMRRGIRRRGGASDDQSTDKSTAAEQDREVADPWGRELLEILIQQPESVSLAVRSIGRDELMPGPLRELYTVYCDLASGNIDVRFDRVLTELEDPRLKSLLVDLDETAREKKDKAMDDAQTRLEGLIENFRQRKEQLQRREQVAALSQHQLNEQEEIDILNQLIEQKRRGISAPTDG